METLTAVGNLINCLTENEDIRQDLWVYYLSGNSIDTLPSQLDKILICYSDDVQIKHAIWNIIQNPASDGLTALLDQFSDFERSILCCLMLGFNFEQISKHRGISVVRIKQTVSNIRYNVSWRQYEQQNLHKVQNK